MSRATEFIQVFEERRPIFAKELRRTYEKDQELFVELAEPMLTWAQLILGSSYQDTLIDGYCEFVMDVNRSQALYESTGSYPHSSFAEVFEQTYNDTGFMNLYHWGVFTTTFGWFHHLELYRFFRDGFLELLKTEQAEREKKLNLLDLGCGSGIWHFLAHDFLPDILSTGVDISETSIDLTSRLSSSIFGATACNYVAADAISWKAAKKFDAGISCFLLEHLEQPQKLLENLARHLKIGGHAFVTCALTAAEVDHIFEFKLESEVVLMAEQAGFRVVKAFSSAPTSIPPDRKYLPRSMGLILQVRKNETW